MQALQEIVLIVIVALMIDKITWVTYHSLEKMQC